MKGTAKSQGQVQIVGEVGKFDHLIVVLYSIIFLQMSFHLSCPQLLEYSSITWCFLAHASLKIPMTLYSANAEFLKLLEKLKMHFCIKESFLTCMPLIFLHN